MKSKLILLIITSILVSRGMVTAQDDKASRADIKEQKAWEKQKMQEEKELQRQRDIEATNAMVTQQRFVLEADNLSNKYGSRVPVSPTINFVMVDSLEATLQVGSAYSVGYNGVGGQTLNGRITKYEYSLIGKKKDSYTIRMVFMSGAGIYDIVMMVSPDGNADATIRGNWSGQLNYHGYLVPLGLSKVYKGHSIY